MNLNGKNKMYAKWSLYQWNIIIICLHWNILKNFWIKRKIKKILEFMFIYIYILAIDGQQRNGRSMWYNHVL